MKKTLFAPLILLLLVTTASSQNRKNNKPEKDTIVTNINGQGYQIEIDFSAGKAHNHPSIAVWTETMYGNLMQTLYVTASFGKGVYRYGEKTDDHWKDGIKRYKAALPYFIHKWSKAKQYDDLLIPTPEHPIPDAVTAATPPGDFVLKTRTNNKKEDKFRILLEINQAWDFNDYWHNAKFPGNNEYQASCQPSLIYAVTIDSNDPMESYVMNPIGHGHYAGKDGKIYTDISTLTTAKKIAGRIEVQHIK
ncbi:MAG: hypothetical protein R6V32_09910 [Bacteroidales bacterium]